MLKNKALVGVCVLLGGSVLLYATLNQIMTEQNSVENQAPAKPVVVPKQDHNMIQPLTADIQTEQNILAQKQKEREQRVEQQEKEAQRYLTEQQRIEAEAIARSRAENQLYVKEDEIARPVVTPRPVDTTKPSATTQPQVVEQASPEIVQKKIELTQQETRAAERQAEQKQREIAQQQKQQQEKLAKQKRQKEQEQAKQQQAQLEKQKLEKQAQEKAEQAQRQKVEKQQSEQQKQAQLQAQQQEKIRPSTYQVKRGEGLIQLSRRYNVPVDALAQANGLDKNTSLRVGQQLIIPSEKQAKRLQQEAQAQAQQKQQFQTANDKLKEARQTAKTTDAKGTFGVQVALASDQKKADEIAKKLQSAGYKVKTSQTSRGVRVVVGPETGKDTALALKDKINADSRVDVSNAWVLYW
ncbi:LysM peptidoglycan-binding domain-containing protein [Faucicola boevrei]|uniref:LysM peptidoglycan-binding domain-containing protein n=1 Tax=Faucicola boevrei TaxID=346665 RepID=UPI0003779F3D|nr:LysM peptidoglycan-binding domain-containing protein [Moraxella boevrei]